MSLYVPENLREPGSRITNTEVLQPGDELQFIGSLGTIAMIGVLDAHDPSSQYPFLRTLFGPDLVLSNHHHVLAKLEGEDEVVSTGLYVGTGAPEDLFFAHVSRRQHDDLQFQIKLDRLHYTVLQKGNHGLYYVSSEERLSALPEAQPYLNEQGGLLIDPPEGVAEKIE